MRVAIFTDTFPPEINGVATSSYTLMKTLEAHGDEVIAVTTNPFSNQFSYIDHIIRIPGFELKKLYGYRIAGFYNSKGMDILRSFKPDICHIQGDAGICQFGYIVASRLKVPTVATFHTAYEDYTYYATKGHFDRFAKNVVRHYFRFVAHRNDELVTPSAKTMEYMRGVGVDNYVAVVPTGVDFSSFDRKNVDMAKVEEARNRLGIPKDKKVLLFLGRVAKEKSIDILIRGYGSYLKLHPDSDTVFVIVGGGPALYSLKELAGELGISDHIIFAGPVRPDVVPIYYALGDYFLSASISETQGLTFMEAMAAGLVLLIRYDDALADTVNDGKDGFFFQSENDFPEKLERLLALNPTTLEGIKAEAMKSIEPYSLERFYLNIRKVYERAIRKNW